MVLESGRGCYPSAVSLGAGALSGIYRVASADDQSRYLGPVSEADRWGVYAPVWVGE